MSYQEVYKQKLTTADEAVKAVKSGDWVDYGWSVCSADALDKALARRMGELTDVKIRGGILTHKPAIFDVPNAAEHLCWNSWHMGGIERKAVNEGLAYYIPLRYSELPGYYRNCIKSLDVAMFQVAPMDEHGYFTTGTVGMSNRMMVENADIVILEIDENMPRTFGNTYIHVSEASCVYQGPNEMFYMPERPQSELDLKIGQFVADLIEDESTLQLGIGGIPNAVAVALRDKHNLGVHTEMLSDSLIDLYRAGVVTNSAKTLHKDKMVTAFSFGSKAAYDFLDNNPNVLHLEVGYTNDPAVIRQNRKMVSVNTTLQVDLTGQCASESIGTLQLSGTGGQTETASGARQSEGGKSIIALHSTANVKNADGERERVSTIVPTQPAGMAISLMRADVDFVVTEYGVASLRGASVRDRAMELISIAHPDYRDQLMYDAKRLYLM